MPRRPPLHLLLLLAGGATLPLSAQLPTASVTRMFVDSFPQADGSLLIDTAFVVRVGGSNFLAISPRREKANQMADTSLRIARAELAILQSDVAALRDYQALAVQTVRLGDSLLTLHRENEADYKRMAKVYEKMAREEFLSLEGGLGITDLSGSSEPALLLGAGFRRFRAWGFFQKGNTGVAVGMHLPLLRF